MINDLREASAVAIPTLEAQKSTSYTVSYRGDAISKRRRDNFISDSCCKLASATGILLASGGMSLDCFTSGPVQTGDYLR